MTDVSINHNGVPFYFPADVAKEGSSYVRIEDYLKVRVHDNGKVVPFKWYDQGRVMNVHGYIPFIQGLVGQYTTDDDNEVVMAPDASYRDWQGTTANAHDGGYMDYILEDQMFPQEGVFKGHFGLKDTSGNILTSVNIIFEVLGDDLRIGETTKYYSSQLDKMVNEFKTRTDKALKDLSDDYQSVAQTAHDTATANQAELDAVRANIKKAADSAGDIQAEIDAKAVETKLEHKKDIDTIGQRIDDRLARISTETPAFASLDELRAKYPQGTDGLFRVADRGFMWRNNQWTDVGALPSAAISDADYNERVGMFLIFSGQQSVTISEGKNEKTGLYAGTMHIPAGTILYLGNHGDFYEFDKDQDVAFGYTLQNIQSQGLATFYFDGESNVYANFKPNRRNDVKIFSIAYGRIFGGSQQGVVVNSIANGGWGNTQAAIMRLDDDKIINISQNDQDGFTVDIPKGILSYTEDGVFYVGKTAQKLTSKDSFVNLNFDLQTDQYYLTSQTTVPGSLHVASLYQDKVYASDTQCFVVNGIDNGGWGQHNKIGMLMYLPLWGNQPVAVTETDLEGGGYQYTVEIPDKTMYITHDGYQVFINSKKLTTKGGPTEIIGIYVNSNGDPYLANLSSNPKDVLLASLFSHFAYGINTDDIVVNGIDHGGFGRQNQNGMLMYLPLWGNQPVAVTETDLEGGGYQYTVSIPDNTMYINSNGCQFKINSKELTTKGSPTEIIGIYVSSNGDPYLANLSSNSKDVLLASLFSHFAYGINTDDIVVNGIDHGGFGQIYEKKRDLNDWRIAAANQKPANIAWLGDSTFQGYKTSSPDHIAGNYINTLLPNDYKGVASYVCAIGGYTTQNMYDHFDDLLKLNNAKDIGLVLIGGGLNDSGNITDEAKYLDLIIKKVRMIGATPVIITTQATALLNTNHDQGDDWTGKLNSDFAKTNQIRREYAKMHNIDLIDLEKYQNDYVEYGPAKLSEMFDDYLHGHDDMHKFGAEFIFSELAADYVDIIKKPKVISVTTMKAKSELMAHKTNFELTDSSLNRKGFKASMKRTDVTSDQIVIDYQFFIPASEEQYYLNGYNLGDPVNVSLNGDITQLTGTQKVATLEPGYYHVIVKPTTANINFVGLRIETDNLAESTVQPVQPTTPQTQPASGTAPANTEPAKQETGETSSKPAETQAQPTEQNKDSDKQ